MPSSFLPFNSVLATPSIHLLFAIFFSHVRLDIHISRVLISSVCVGSSSWLLSILPIPSLANKSASRSPSFQSFVIERKRFASRNNNSYGKGKKPGRA